MLGWDSVVGNYASPYAAGSAYVLLHHCFGEVNGKAGQWGHAIGGMGAITQAMADEARARGVQIDVWTRRGSACWSSTARRSVCSLIAARRSAHAAWCPTSTRSCCTGA